MTRGFRSGLACALVLAMAASTACTRPAPDSTPEGAVRLWLEKMEASTEDPSEMRDAYALLGPKARANLEERAQRASRLQGRRVDAFEMLAEGRFGLRFRPKAMNARIAGNDATVEVVGDQPLTEHAIVKCARDPQSPSAWRVEPDLPALSTLVRAVGDGG